MTYPAAGPKPFPGSRPSSREENLIPQARETGPVVASGPSKDARTVTQDGPAVKPWAHFVAGGYDRCPGTLPVSACTDGLSGLAA